MLALAASSSLAQDPCATIAGQTWVGASDVRACYNSLSFETTIRNNIVEVVNKTMAFHTSTNYQVQAPAPFEDVHEDIIGTLARINSQTYDSDFDLHVDIATSTRRMGDGHSVYVSMCYDNTYTSFVPVPLVLLQNNDGTQDIYVDPQAYKVFSQDFFSGQVEIWQQALGNDIPLETLSGAKVIAIDNEDPWKAVDAAAAAAGGYQSFTTRQNSFFASFAISASAWSYLPGLFAQMSLPLKDSVTLTIQRANSSASDIITLPFRSRLHENVIAFTDKASFWNNNCLATSTTNGSPNAQQDATPAIARFSAQASRNSTTRLIVNEMLDVNSALAVPMPASLRPPRSNYQAAWDTFGWILDDKKTGLFSSGNFRTNNEISLMVGLMNLVRGLSSRNATRLVIDVSNNQGGLVCASALLHYYFMGNKTTTSPQALLPTKFRAQPLAQKIVDNVITSQAVDTWYYPTQWKNAENEPFSATTNYLREGAEDRVINGRPDVFSQTIGQECQPFYYFDMPQAPVWKGEIVIVSNGRCASSCALFVNTMAKLENVKVVSIGGKFDTPQQYAGTVGGQSLDFSAIDSDIKAAGLKDDPLAPPDFITNSYQGITWRLAQGVFDEDEPEEWQSREAAENYQLTAAVVNDPWKLWNDMAAKFFED
ncbi:hypothetical protein V5O48_013702 [Marasmius crinis-equi]|uniref:Tail specific protease domain-containing protein n=1 Tax=Marasmius crinis-equi TaxID=585013 RepID=A0ABR3EZD4_9AGAR